MLRKILESGALKIFENRAIPHKNAKSIRIGRISDNFRNCSLILIQHAHENARNRQIKGL